MAKKLHREIEKIVSRHADDYEIDKNRTGHIKVTVRFGKHLRRISTGGSPSCPHALNQFERDVKRAMAELKGEKERHL